MRVTVCDNPSRWDAYVSSVPHASNYHRWGWRTAIENSFGHEAYYLTATDNDAIKGVLPLVLLKSRLFGFLLASMPFFSYGGVLADNPEARNALLAATETMAKQLGVSHVELRQGEAQQLNEWHESCPKVTMGLTLPAKVEDYWVTLSSGMRNKIRKAQKNQFRIEFSGVESVGVFYEIFSTNMRNLGTPVYPRRWFRNLCEQFPEEVRVLVLKDGNQPVAAGIVTSFRDGLELPWSATLPESRKKYSAVLMYWALLEWAITHGYRHVDFGRCTKGSGVYQFKQHWNSEERPLHWYYWLAPGVSVPELRPDNPRYRLATSIWMRLPITVANLLGPRIARSIP